MRIHGYLALPVMMVALLGFAMGSGPTPHLSPLLSLRCDTVATPSKDGPGQIGNVAVARTGALAWTEGYQEKSVGLRAATGRLMTLGRKGGGPGEFEFVAAISWRRDTLWISDTRLRRVQAFSGDGRWLASFPLPILAAFVARADSGFGATLAGIPATKPGVPVEIDPRATPLLLVSYHPGSGRTDTTLRVDPAPRDRVSNIPEFSSRLLGAHSTDGRYWCILSPLEGARFQLTCLDEHGRRYLQGPRQLEERPLPTALWATLTKALAEESGSSLEEILRIFVRPANVPAALEIVVGTAGEVWIRRSALHEPIAIWDRIGANGIMLPRVTIPGRLQLRAVMGRDIYAADTDSDGLQVLERCRLAS